MSRAWSGGTFCPNHSHFPRRALDRGPSSPFQRPTKVHEESSMGRSGSGRRRPASTCSDAALTRTVAFSASRTPRAARADLMTLRSLAGVVDQLRTFGRDGRGHQGRGMRRASSGSVIAGFTFVALSCPSGGRQRPTRNGRATSMGGVEAAVDAALVGSDGMEDARRAPLRERLREHPRAPGIHDPEDPTLPDMRDQPIAYTRGVFLIALKPRAQRLLLDRDANAE